MIGATKPEFLGFHTANDGAIASPGVFPLVMAAGFGSAAFFRSSILKMRTPDGEISVGPALIIDVFLKVIDEAVDRSIGEKCLIEVSSIMKDVDFDKAAKSLSAYCFAALKRLSPETQQQFALQLRALADNKDIDPAVRANSLGLSIMTVTGKPILECAVRLMGERIKINGPNT